MGSVTVEYAMYEFMRKFSFPGWGTKGIVGGGSDLRVGDFSTVTRQAKFFIKHPTASPPWSADQKLVTFVDRVEITGQAAETVWVDQREVAKMDIHRERLLWDGLIGGACAGIASKIGRYDPSRRSVVMALPAETPGALATYSGADPGRGIILRVSRMPPIASPVHIGVEFKVVFGFVATDSESAQVAKVFKEPQRGPINERRIAALEAERDRLKVVLKKMGGKAKKDRAFTIGDADELLSQARIDADSAQMMAHAQLMAQAQAAQMQAAQMQAAQMQAMDPRYLNFQPQFLTPTGQPSPPLVPPVPPVTAKKKFRILGIDFEW